MRKSEFEFCTVEGCTRTPYAKSLRNAHYIRQRNGQDMSLPIRKREIGVWGDWQLNTGGYVFRSRTVDSKQEFQLQHRVVMEEKIGRPLYKQETVHHINGVKTDNRIENLELWTSNHPSGQRVEDIVTWAKEMLELYT